MSRGARVGRVSWHTVVWEKKIDHITSVRFAGMGLPQAKNEESRSRVLGPFLEAFDTSIDLVSDARRCYTLQVGYMQQVLGARNLLDLVRSYALFSDCLFFPSMLGGG